MPYLVATGFAPFNYSVVLLLCAILVSITYLIDWHYRRHATRQVIIVYNMMKGVICTWEGLLYMMCSYR
ncbi:hypothetical protein GGS20DRAFT_566068 [Poronia punctata]|nr:hypothetical protein GGS20DRAFT_566068 [Poronia punctata]